MTDFQARVFAAVERIPRGKAAPYSEVARAAGSPRAMRAVGNILHSNPFFGVVPCHRVVHADGALADAFAFGGEGVQRKMLESEGVIFTSDGRVDMRLCGCVIPVEKQDKSN